MRVMFRADFSRFTGYGNDAIDLSMSLDSLGYDVVPFPRQITPGLPPRFTRLLEKNPLQKPDAACVFMDPVSVDEKMEGRLADRTLLYTMWEKTPFHEGEFRKDSTRRDLQWVDRLVVTCPMNVAAFEQVARGVPMAVVPAGVWLDQWPDVVRQPKKDRPFRFLMVGVMSVRKNPFAVLEVWREIKREMPEFDAELLIHSTSPNLHPGVADAYGPDVTIQYHRLTHEQMVKMYHEADVMVAPSRGEGNNKPAMEFMCTGGPVIASDWSGHQNWLHESCGWPVPGRLVPSDGTKRSSWFEVDRDALKAAMIDAWRHPEIVRRKGMASRQFIGAFDWETIAKRFARELEACRG
jgi:glycosyltransferase involved in cell wall biosynthesis